MTALRTRAGIRCCTLLLAALALGDCSDATSPHETYPGGGQLIAFVSSRDGPSEIYTMHPDGGHVTRLTNSSALDYMPQLSPDRTRVAYTSNRDGDWKVYVMNVDGSDLHLVSVAGALVSQSPSWSPDGRRLVYDSFDGSEQAVWTVDPDGSHQQKLVPGSFAVWGPTRIAFGLAIGGHRQIFTMKPDGSDVQQITYDVLDDYAGGWSPDGTRIVFDAGDPNIGIPSQLFTINADGSDRTELLPHQTGSEDAVASYSPDGSRIIFESTRGGATWDLYTIRSDGTNLERLTNGPGGNSGPSWR